MKRRDQLPANIVMTEDMLQVYSADVIKAFRAPFVIAYHVPNGGKRHIAVAKKLQSFGTLPGVADWAFVLPDGSAAFIELKSAKGVLNSDQIKFQAACNAIDVPYLIARTPEQFDTHARALGAINKPVTQPAVGRGASCGAGAATVSRSRPQTRRAPR
jgi:hypothetical protein